MKRLTTHTEMSLKVKKTHRSCKALLAVWAGIQPGISPAAGHDGDGAGRPGPSLRAELSRPAACTIPEATGPQTRASVQGMLHYSGLDLEQPTQEKHSIALKLDFPPKSQQPSGIIKIQFPLKINPPSSIQDSDSQTVQLRVLSGSQCGGNGTLRT